jgi:uncharacterized protein (TIGR02147 family)
MNDRPPPSVAEILRDVLATKISRNPSFSLRAFARDLGVSHTYLSLVLNKKKALSMGKLLEFSQILGMNSEQTQLFLRAAQSERGERATRLASERPARAVNNEGFDIQYFEFENEKNRVLQDWYHLPVLDLTLTSDFKSDPKWMAKRLGISTEQVRSAIDRLKRLGLLEEKDGILKKTHTFLEFSSKKSARVARTYHQEMIQKAIQTLEHASDEDVARRDVYTVTIPADPSKLPEAKKRIEKFRRSLWKFLASGNQTELYQFNLQLIPLTSPIKPVSIKSVSGKVLKKGSKRVISAGLKRGKL